MDTDSLNIHIKTEYFYEYIADDGGKRFDASNSEINRPLPTREMNSEETLKEETCCSSTKNLFLLNG